MYSRDTEDVVPYEETEIYSVKQNFLQIPRRDCRGG